jgi:transposase
VPQFVFGLLTNHEGCPVAVEVFEGHTGDPKTEAAQIRKRRQRFPLKEVVLVGDRGMLTSARIREDLETEEGVRWITALKALQIQQLASAGNLQLSLFDQPKNPAFAEPHNGMWFEAVTSWQCGTCHPEDNVRSS